MSKNHINIFHHPTTAIFLDDDSTFFSNIHFKIAKQLRCQYYQHIDQAIDATQQPFDTLSSSYGSELIHSDTPIRDTLFSGIKPMDNRRVLEPSVFVVDYQMPGMNGLDVCRHITNPYISKLLLTGIADEKIAIQALNEGTIDYYLHKSEADLSLRIVAAVKHLQHQYFHRLIKDYRFYYQPPHLSDPAFNTYFTEICEELAIVEHYYMDSPQGVLLIDKKGKASVLLAYCEEEIKAHINHCHQQQAPRPLIDELIEGRSIPFFPRRSYYFYDSSLLNWQDYLHKATHVSGCQTYFCSLLPNPATQELLPGYQDIILASYQN